MPAQRARQPRAHVLETPLPGSGGGAQPGPVYVVPVGRLPRAAVEQRIATLPPTATIVHCEGHPYIWVIRAVLERCPGLRTLQVIPSGVRKLTITHRALCDDRSVRIVVGAIYPERTGERANLARTAYQAQRAFMQGLAEEQRVLFEELLALGFEIAEIAARYFGLDGQDAFISQARVAEEFGLAPRTGNVLVSRMVGALLRYLDPTCRVGKASLRTAEALAVRVKRLRQTALGDAVRQEWLVRLGIPAIPPGLRPARFDLFEFVLSAFRAGRLAALDERTQGILRKRYGLDNPGVAPAVTLQEIGDGIGLTRERARQLERDGLVALGWNASTLD